MNLEELAKFIMEMQEEETNRPASYWDSEHKEFVQIEKEDFRQIIYQPGMQPNDWVIG